ncbi:PREDICTED: coiled-coil domain-containing protein 180-like [Priapulus caudatus]|uniref:Coiled-coil domain-containing protein 180-like n=1 Tax=Priapulus caudatus TaxID=37621 RepID=A0ABM1EIR5_PRICU|nr:PREDICTED: coiled-coil domain-containing protein 180-like [Priapulus caudatus]
MDADVMVEIEEVKALLDTNTAAENVKCSDIIERVEAVRKIKHDNAVRNMRAGLNQLWMEFASVVDSQCKQLSSRLMDNLGHVQQLSSGLQEEKSWNRNQLEHVWEEIAAEFTERRKWVDNLDEALTAMESHHTTRVRAILKTSYSELHVISHLMPNQLHWFMDREAQTANTQLLRQRRTFADLNLMLVTSEAELERSDHNSWKLALERWQAQEIQDVVQVFSQFMQTDDVTKPAAVTDALLDMAMELTALADRRREVVQAIGQLQPPAACQMHAVQLCDTLKDISDDFQLAVQRNLETLHGIYEAVCKSCLDRVDRLLHDLISCGCCTDTEAKLLVKEQVGEQELDIVLDKLRQSSGEADLNQQLKVATQLLDSIREEHKKMSYRKVHLIKRHPRDIDGDVVHYESAIYSYFSVVKEEELQDVDGVQEVSARETIVTSRGTVFHRLASNEAAVVSMEQLDEMAYNEDDPITEPKPSVPEDIVDIAIGDGEAESTTEQIRFGFLDHTETWRDETLHQAAEFVSVRLEQCDADLNLKLQLHDARKGRIEQDIYQVRLAELHTHGDRVSTHCRGVLAALAEVRQGLAVTTSSLDDAMLAFKLKVAEKGKTVAAAAKSDELLQVQELVKEDMRSHMDLVRQELMHYRQDIEASLGKLHRSSAEFLNNIRLFSEGGNYCTEETDVIRTRLEKVSHQLNTAENALCGDLEDVQNAQDTKSRAAIAEFVDKLKNHMADLVFVEATAKLLTTTQIGIKSEVASSNSQAARLIAVIEELTSKLSGDEPLGRELLDVDLPAAVAMCTTRCEFLNCKQEASCECASQSTLTAMPAVQEPEPHATEQYQGTKRILAIEDPSIAVIQELTRIPSFGEREEQVGFQKSKVMLAIQSWLPPTSTTSNSRPASTPEKKKQHNLAQPSRLGKPASIQSSYKMEKNSYSGRAQRRSNKYDRKYQVFGEQQEDGNYFLVLIRNLLRKNLDSLLTATHLYYRQKGLRAVTRPRMIKETQEQCCELLVEKALLYYSQALTYNNECLQEFRDQLTKLESLSGRLAERVIEETVTAQRSAVSTKINLLLSQLEEKRIEWVTERRALQSSLRPTLGHPSNADRLSDLCKQESSRSHRFTDNLEQHSTTIKEDVTTAADDLVTLLAGMTERLVEVLDSILTPSDVMEADTTPAPHTTADLLTPLNKGCSRNMLPQESELDVVPEGKLPNSTSKGHQSGKWPGLTFLVREEVSAEVFTENCTESHVATISARDKAYKEVQEWFVEQTSHHMKLVQQLHLEESQWTKTWQNSVASLQKLF